MGLFWESLECIHELFEVLTQWDLFATPYKTPKCYLVMLDNTLKIHCIFSYREFIPQHYTTAVWQMVHDT
jgi:hypothetical protein